MWVFLLWNLAARKLAGVGGGMGRLATVISPDSFRSKLKGLVSNGKVISRLNKDAPEDIGGIQGVFIDTRHTVPITSEPRATMVGEKRRIHYIVAGGAMHPRTCRCGGKGAGG